MKCTNPKLRIYTWAKLRADSQTDFLEVEEEQGGSESRTTETARVHPARPHAT